MCYLKAIANHGLHITSSFSFALHSFIDVDWADSVDDCKFTYGYLIYLGNTLVFWKSRKQRIVVHSFTEVKYKALTDDTTKIVWIRSILLELHLPFISIPILWCDNLGPTYLSMDPIFHACTKHIKVDYYFFHDIVATKEFKVWFISSKNQLADVLIKYLPYATFVHLRFKLDIESPPSP